MDVVGAYIAELWKTMLQNWDLALSKIVAITTDNGANMVSAAQQAGFLRIPCFGHVLHNGVNKSLDNQRITAAKGNFSCTTQHRIVSSQLQVHVLLDWNLQITTEL